MPRKKTTTSPPIKSFQKEVEKALKQIKDPEWLGMHSLLAAPYSLAEYLREQKIDAADPYQRGKALQKLLRNTIHALGTENTNLLRLYYLEGLSEKETYAELSISKATFQRNRKKAISELGVSLNKRLKPALRAEVPRPRGDLLERNKLTTICLHMLKEGKSVGLTGPGGIGKTTLGQHIAAQTQSAFWFTFRLGLNDNFSSLIFALGSFLARQGSSTLWAELIANKKGLQMKNVLGLLRYDLSDLNSKRLVLCFDEVDLLHPAELEGHATLLTFLESLKGLAPLLFIGQQLPLDVETHYYLKNLSSNSIQLMLKRNKITLTTADLVGIETHTQGNPRLLELFIGLHRAGESIESLLAELSGVPSVEFLLKRMWQRLNEDQQTMLFFLVPFRRAAPRDAWNQAGEQEVLTELIKRRLVQAPDFGQLELLPAFRSVIYKQLSGDNRKTVHLRAAKIRRERAEYTLAADHYLQAGEDEIAFRLWYEYQEQEINQGQAGAGLAILEKISSERLKKKDQERLALSQANVLRITGQYEQSRQALTSIKWETPTLGAQAKRLEGDIAELKGEFEEATNSYFTGLHTIEKLLSEKAQFHKNLGWMATREQNDLDHAWHEAMRAHYEAINLKGYVEEQRHNYKKSQVHYEEALKLAQKANYDYGQGKTYNNLGRILILQGEFDAAQEHLEQAYQFFKRRGQISSIASAKVNQAVHYNFARKHKVAIQLAQDALDIFERLDEPWGRDVALLNLAEAYLGTNDLENAEIFAQKAIQGEGQPAHEAWWTLGEIRLAQKKYPNSVECLQKALVLSEKHGYSILEGYTQRSLGKTYRAMDEDDRAEAAFDKAIELFERLGMQNEVEETPKVRTGE